MEYSVNEMEDNVCSSHSFHTSAKDNKYKTTSFGLGFLSLSQDLCLKTKTETLLSRSKPRPQLIPQEQGQEFWPVTEDQE